MMSILYYSQPKNVFSDLYIKVREKENRLYSIEQIKNLPNLEKNHPHYKEWQLRKKSTARFIAYLSSKKSILKILDIGCGNGWFSHLMSDVENVEVAGLDINITELEQASKAFQKDNLTFVYADLYETTKLNSQKFDIIVFNGCLQYFEDKTALFEIITKLLNQNGEIHIMDTPFYNDDNIESARKRTQIYYQELGFPEMSKNYFHHGLDSLGRYKVLYNPFSFLNYFRNDSPFYWVLIKKDAQ